MNVHHAPGKYTLVHGQCLEVLRKLPADKFESCVTDPPYELRLVTPPGGCVLDPFTGSGSTGVAALQEGVMFVGMEREAEYVPIARARLEHAAQKFNP